MAVTKRLVEKLDPGRQVAEIWKALKDLGPDETVDRRLFEHLTPDQKVAEIWQAIKEIDAGGGVEAGRELISTGAVSKSVVFDEVYVDVPSVVPSIQKPLEASDNIYVVATLVNETGFTAYFNGETPTNGYYLHWHAREIEFISPTPGSPSADSTLFTADTDLITADAS